MPAYWFVYFRRRAAWSENHETINQIPPPPHKLTALAAALLLAVSAVTAQAQGLPEISIRIETAFQNIAETVVQSCTSETGGLPVEIRASRGAQGVTVNTLAYTVSGYNRLYDRNVPVYISPNNQGPVVFRSRGAATYTGNSTNWFRLAAFSGGAGSPCFPDDLLITGESVIQVVLMPGTGYTINPDMRSVLINVDDENGEECSNGNHITASGGRLYKVQNGNLNDTCVCSNKSLAAIDEPYDGYTPLTPDGLNEDPVVYGDIPTYGESSLKWVTDTTNYCKDSPYQRPGG